MMTSYDSNVETLQSQVIILYYKGKDFQNNEKKWIALRRTDNKYNSPIRPPLLAPPPVRLVLRPPKDARGRLALAIGVWVLL